MMVHIGCGLGASELWVKMRSATVLISGVNTSVNQDATDSNMLNATEPKQEPIS